MAGVRTQRQRTQTSVAASEIPLFNLRAQHRQLRQELAAVAERVLETSIFVLGENVAQFEEQMADYCGARYAVGVASGSDALLLSLVALGIGPGDEVILPVFTFAATAAVICHVGARPVFVDCQPGGFNLDIEQVADRITSRTKAVMPVHLYGEAIRIEPLLELAQRHGIRIVEDCAQAVGARYNGKRVGSLGDTGCFSFYPTKNLGACGDGGMVITNDAELAQRLRYLRNQADDALLGGARYHHSAPGYNSRLDEIQAAILRVKLNYLDEWNGQRQARAERYRRLLASSGVVLPPTAPERSHVYNLFTIRTPFRDELQQFLASKGVHTAVYYPFPLHLQAGYRWLGYQPGDFPHGERTAREVLSLPLYPELTPAQMTRIASLITAFMNERNQVSRDGHDEK